MNSNLWLYDAKRNVKEMLYLDKYKTCSIIFGTNNIHKASQLINNHMQNSKLL